MVAGVCAGIAESQGLSPLAVRMATVFATAAGVPTLLLYLVLALMLPVRGPQTRQLAFTWDADRARVDYRVPSLSRASKWIGVGLLMLLPTVVAGLAMAGGVLLAAEEAAIVSALVLTGAVAVMAPVLAAAGLLAAGGWTHGVQLHLSPLNLRTVIPGNTRDIRLADIRTLRRTQTHLVVTTRHGRTHIPAPAHLDLDPIVDAIEQSRRQLAAPPGDGEKRAMEQLNSLRRQPAAESDS